MHVRMLRFTTITRAAKISVHSKKYVSVNTFFLRGGGGEDFKISPRFTAHRIAIIYLTCVML